MRELLDGLDVLLNKDWVTLVVVAITLTLCLIGEILGRKEKKYYGSSR
jgi:hypothetical protein